MTFDENILKYDEKAVFVLRELYSKYGYRQFKMSKFEEYDLYVRNKDFLISDGIITFTDTNGKLLALKPDVTLSIINNSKELNGGTEKYYYNENVYRISESSHSYKEIMQTGLECIGEIGESEIFEVTELAAKSLSLIANDFMLHLSHIGLVNALFDEYEIPKAIIDEITKAITEKNTGVLKALLSVPQFEALKVLVKSYGSTASALSAIESIAKTSGQYSFEERMGCGFGACMGCSCKTLTGYKRICKEGPVMKKEEILWEA